MTNFMNAIKKLRMTEREKQQAGNQLYPKERNALIAVTLTVLSMFMVAGITILLH